MGDNFNQYEWFRKQRLSEAVSMDALDRIEGLANIRDLKLMKDSLRILTAEWVQEGFEKEDIKDYISYLIDNI
tara:strand:- start:465 stop:683 length:219 start_codon:yes stop_codon:yes gene_type:complete